MPSLAGFAENAIILVHEAMLESGVDYVTAKTGNTDERLYRHLIASHSFAHEAGRIAHDACLLYTSPSPRDATLSRMPSSA